MARKELFGIFSPVLGEEKDFPTILLDKTIQVENSNIVRKYGEIHRRQMREPDMLDSGDAKSQTPDTNPIIHYHLFVKRSTAAQYLLAFTKAHIYLWNSVGETWDVKFTCSADCTEWSTVTYNDKVIATNNVDMVLVWDTTGYFIPLQNTTPIVITNATRTNPCKVTAGTHGLTNGDRVFIKDVVGMTEINNLQFIITVVDPDNFTLNGVNSSAYTAYDSAGTVVEFEGIEYSRAYSNETSVDVTSAIGQNVLSVAATTGYVSTDKIVIGRGTVREEEAVVDSVQAGVSLTLISNLTYTHTANAKTTVDADSAAGQKVLNVASTTNYAADEYVSINIGGDRWEVRKIDTIQEGVSLTFTVNLSYEHTAVQGDEVVGTAGTNDTVEEYTSSYLTKAKYVTTFENYLELGYTYEDGTSHPQRIRWSDIGDETDWAADDAGSAETEGADFITGFKIYSGKLIIFKELSRIIQTLVSYSDVWNWVKMPGAIGCLSNHSIVEDPDGRVYWLANDLTFREMETGEISHAIDPIVKLIEPSSAHLVYGQFMDETGEIWWSIPYDNALNNKVITYKEGSWGELDLSIPAFGNYKEA
jgi:hypothetical protein